ncbi:MAG: T9SS type A sorting domain-containing protein [bacterium]|nr:T9SS type A sorting domain-containing protein [bacterium]
MSVELTSFTASILQNEKAVQLNWTTVTETNNSGFEVERASSRTTPRQEGWESIGFVPGFGTTIEPKSYSFTDENVSTGTYKYRLKQIDFDGSFEFSNEIEIEVDFTPKEFVLYQNYPNPFNPSTTIKFTVTSVIASGAKQSQFVTLKVYDIIGSEVATLVNEEKQPGVYEVEFDASSLASGMYLYKLQAGTYVQIKKMVLMK